MQHKIIALKYYSFAVSSSELYSCKIMSLSLAAFIWRGVRIRLKPLIFLYSPIPPANLGPPRLCVLKALWCKKNCRQNEGV